MNWLDSDIILKLVGLTKPAPPGAWPVDALAAVAAAEEQIQQLTGLVWGETITETLTITLRARSFTLRVPRDVTSVTVLSPSIGTNIVQLGRHGVELFDSVWDALPWPAGTIRLEVQRGITDIPHTVNRAAALLVQHHLSPADPTRSQFDEHAQGDFAGSMRRDAFPVPEAATLLQPWVSSGRVGAG